MRTLETLNTPNLQVANTEAAALYDSQIAAQEPASAAVEPFWDPNAVSAQPANTYVAPGSQEPLSASDKPASELPGAASASDVRRRPEDSPKVSKIGKIMGKLALKFGSKKGTKDAASRFAPAVEAQPTSTFMNTGSPLPESALTNNPFLLPGTESEIITSVPWTTPEAPETKPAAEIITQVPTFEVPKPKQAEAVDSKEAARLMETRRFVRSAPRFDEQLGDSSRTNIFRWEASGRTLLKQEADPSKVFDMTEQEGMIHLAGFLDTYLAYEKLDDMPDPHLMKQARSIRENLTFIGEKEYTEAVAGLAEMWKGFLDGDPKRQMCVTAEIAKAYQGDNQRKSDAYLFDRIMEHFTDDELEKYAGRLVKSPDELTAGAEDVRVVILDDWSISGSQASRVFEKFKDEPWFAAYSKSIEINLLTSIKSRIENGLSASYGGGTRVPVRSYFVSHDAPDSSYGSHTTGTHSSVDFDFENTINLILAKLRSEVAEDHGQARAEEVNMPPLTNIDRPYRRTKPAFVADEKGHIIRNRE